MKLFSEIEKLVPTLGGWTTVPKAQTYAAIILALRPDVSVEIGVWWGRGALSMGLAHKEVGKGVVYAIDPWSPQASIEGQVQKADVDHWQSADHEAPYKEFLNRINLLGLGECMRVLRQRSDQTTPPENIGFLVIDGNHGPAAIEDVKRFAPKVRVGGIAYMDDLNWSGGAVLKAFEDIKKMGFVELYKFETGAFLQRL